MERFPEAPPSGAAVNSPGRTRVTKRSKAACAVALSITVGCAIFGVGGAAAGDSTYASHLREARLEARLAGADLAHRTPSQLVLAVTPKTDAASTTPAVTTTTPAVTTTTPAVTTTTPAATTTTSTTSTTTTPTTTTPTTTTPNPTSPTNDQGASNGTTANGQTTDANTSTTPGATTPPDNAAGIGGNGYPNTGNPTGNYGYGNGYGHGNGTGNGSGNNDGNTASTTGNGGTGSAASTSPECHGRCSGTGQSQTAGVVPSAVPSTTTSPSTTGDFNLGVSSTAASSSSSSSSASSAATNVPTDASTTLLNAPSSTPGSTAGSPSVSLNSIPSFASSSALRKVTKGATTDQSHTTTLASGGTGGAAALGGHTTAATPGATAGAGTTTGTTHGAKPTDARSVHHVRHQNSGGSGLTAPFTPAVKVIDQVVKVIPTGLWIALGAAFGLALACAAVALRSSRRARRREHEFVAISAAAQTDPLTGILNRRGFMDAAERELARASRYNRPFVLAYVDVRGLKAVNDTEGHLMGDELIKTVAGLMKESARADDVVGRIGGDEFALLLGEQTAESAEPVVRRIRARVEERRAAMEIDVPWELTIGIAGFPDDGTTLEDLLGVADRRLYEQRGIALR